MSKTEEEAFLSARDHIDWSSNDLSKEAYLRFWRRIGRLARARARQYATAMKVSRQWGRR